MKSRGSATLELFDEEYRCNHSPDAQFRHDEAQYPGVVIEVSYSQKQRDLRSIVDNYILGSDGNIRVVVCLDVDYRNGKHATLSVWRPSIEES